MNRNIIILILVLVVAMGIYLGLRKTSEEGEGGEQVACTADALICPDGSGVGRTGPNCEFSACPNQEFFTGRLIEQGSDFFLATAAPVGVPREVTYSLPLKFSRISNVLGEFVGKNVKVTGEFTTGSTLEVDTIELLSTSAATTGEVKVGETKFINGVRITLNKIIEDSRCPIDAVCIQMGRLVANISLKTDTDQETIDLSTNEIHNIDIFRVSIVGTSPSPMASQPVATSSYKVIFKVEKN